MNYKEQLITNAVQRIKNSPDLIKFQNSTGFQVDIDTLVAIRKSVVTQKFYTLNGKKISDYIPVAVGENAFASEILTWRSFVNADSFESGVVNGTESYIPRTPNADVAIDAVKVPTRYWVADLNYTLIQLGQAARAGNWGLIEEKEKARKKTWDLGIQRAAFLGLDNDSDIKGLLTQPDVTVNTVVIQKPISKMNATEFQQFLKDVVSVYFANTNYTQMPTHFIIPQSDYLGLGRSVDETYPLRSMLSRMYETFATITGNSDFKILPLVYSQKDKNIMGVNRYVLLNYDPDSILFEIPIDYTTTIQDTIQGFQYQGVSYGQFASFKAFRPAEMIYFDHNQDILP